MISSKYYLLLVVYIFLCGCTEEHITNQSNLGNIKGRVVADYQTGYIPVENVSVSIPGTSVSVRTDSMGSFLLINLPAGTYNLEVHSYKYGLTKNIHNISVSPNNTTFVQDIILELRNPPNPIFLDALYVVREYGADIYLGMNDTSVVDDDDIVGDSVLFVGILDRDFYNSQNLNILLTVEYDLDLYNIETSKRLFHFKVPVKENFCKVRIWEGHSNQPINDQFATTIIVTEKIGIWITLEWRTSQGNSAGDFDIRLIDIDHQDSCWYKNPNPDWGIIGFDDDNPYLDDGTNPSGYHYDNEDLSIDFTPEGNYRLKVVYFSNVYNENVQIAPEISFFLDWIYYSYTAPSEMSVGQVWTVLEFNIPSKTIIPINTIGGPGSTKFIKKYNDNMPN